MRALKLPVALGIAAVAFTSTGCFHMTTKLPGVLDLRSDGSEAPTDTKPMKGARSGFDGIVQGDGVDGVGNVTVDDRKFWFLGLANVSNESATEEITAAVGDQALRNITLGEQVAPMDVGISVCFDLIPCANIVTWTFITPIDFKMKGTRAKVADRAPVGDAPVGAPPAGGAPPSVIPPLTPGEE